MLVLCNSSWGKKCPLEQSQLQILQKYSTKFYHIQDFEWNQLIFFIITIFSHCKRLFNVNKGSHWKMNGYIWRDTLEHAHRLITETLEDKTDIFIRRFMHFNCSLLINRQEAIESEAKREIAIRSSHISSSPSALIKKQRSQIHTVQLYTKQSITHSHVCYLFFIERVQLFCCNFVFDSTKSKEKKFWKKRKENSKQFLNEWAKVNVISMKKRKKREFTFGELP